MIPEQMISIFCYFMLLSTHLYAICIHKHTNQYGSRFEKSLSLKFLLYLLSCDGSRLWTAFVITTLSFHALLFSVVVDHALQLSLKVTPFNTQQRNALLIIYSWISIHEPLKYKSIGSKKKNKQAYRQRSIESI